MLSTTGGFRTTAAMANAVRSGACDMVGVARPLKIETDLVRRLLEGKAVGVEGWDEEQRARAKL